MPLRKWSRSLILKVKTWKKKKIPIFLLPPLLLSFLSILLSSFFQTTITTITTTTTITTITTTTTTTTKGLTLLIWDGYRPLSCQKKLWEVCPNPLYVSPPEKGGRHTRGTAVDCTVVVLETGLEMEGK